MWRMERHVPRGGGNSLKPSHNHGLWQVGMFNNLALWGEKKFVSELKRTYKFQRGVYCHTEDNSPKYRMVDEILSILRFFTVQTRITTHHSLKRAGATHVALCESVGSYFRHWCGAFTLAEVLITLGIIGVVAAMTMPSLITAKQEKATISTIKKNYSILANALLMAQNDNGELYTWGITKDADGLNLVSSNLKTYLKIIEDCGVGEKSDCAPGDNGKFKDLTGKKRTEDFSSSDYYSFRLNDGTAVAIQLKTKAECISSESSCMNFYIDTNGKKYPNTLGKDIFYFDGYGNGKLRAAGIDHSPSETGWAAQEGWFTTAWAMYKENLDYLRCPDKLEWNGKSTCK